MRWTLWLAAAGPARTTACSCSSCTSDSQCATGTYCDTVATPCAGSSIATLSGTCRR
ncbi:MAG TPA: hypothetical protein VMB50_24370 [Myxococcales bacterium]|nr:hypothetical protein [Myxococcales bacterium]